MFMGLCHIVGTSQQVAMRRDVVYIYEMVGNKGRTSNVNIVMWSGSDREGFRMKGSDLDAMFWYNNHP
jgi:hypothetical protein